MRRYSQVTGYVLAGGASRRMGRPKAGLTLEGATMLDRTARMLGSVCRKVVVVGESRVAPTVPDVKMLPDDRPGNGPLGGILSALGECSTEYALLLSCDLPYMSRRFLEYLLEVAVSQGAQVTVPQTADGRLQTLAAVYRRTCAGAFRARLACGDLKIAHAFRGLNCRLVSASELNRQGFSPCIFGNMNTPEDYAQALRQFALNGQ
jgi:molybdopterin-guanine dinucleotide biosynthesis protein A